MELAPGFTIQRKDDIGIAIMVVRIVEIFRDRSANMQTNAGAVYWLTEFSGFNSYPFYS